MEEACGFTVAVGRLAGSRCLGAFGGLGEVPGWTSHEPRAVRRRRPRNATPTQQRQLPQTHHSTIQAPPMLMLMLMPIPHLSTLQLFSSCIDYIPPSNRSPTIPYHSLPDPALISPSDWGIPVLPTFQQRVKAVRDPRHLKQYPTGLPSGLPRVQPQFSLASSAFDIHLETLACPTL